MYTIWQLELQLQLKETIYVKNWKFVLDFPV